MKKKKFFRVTMFSEKYTGEGAVLIDVTAPNITTAETKGLKIANAIFRKQNPEDGNPRYMVQSVSYKGEIYL